MVPPSSNQSPSSADSFPPGPRSSSDSAEVQNIIETECAPLTVFEPLLGGRLDEWFDPIAASLRVSFRSSKSGVSEELAHNGSTRWVHQENAQVIAEPTFWTLFLWPGQKETPLGGGVQKGMAYWTIPRAGSRQFIKAGKWAM